MAGFDPVDLTAPKVIADQLQRGRQPIVTNLSDRIVDLTVETSVQGASMIVLSILDPQLKLLTSGFISLDQDQLLEAIDINYPLGSKAWWRLAACDPSTDVTAANLTLTFEDRIVSELRDLMGPKTSKSGETREQFIASLVRDASGIEFVAPTYQQLVHAGTLAGVGSAIATGASVPNSTPKGASPARRNPHKLPGIDPQSRKHVNRHLRKKIAPVGKTVSNAAGSTPITL